MLPIKIFIFYASYLAFFTLIFFGYLFFKFWKTRKGLSIFFLAVCILSGIFIESRFIEPQIIQVRRTTIESDLKVKMALIADIHLGIFHDETFLKRVVNKIKSENVDFVVIAGDFTYYPKKGSLETLFEPLKDVKTPVYAILGNHDVERPGPKVRDELAEALKANKVVLLNNETSKFRDINIIGLGELWNDEADVSLLKKFDEKEKVLTIIHNPDITDLFDGKQSDVTVAGHTHAGQIRIPFLYKKVIPTVGDYDYGFYQKKNTKLFITSGLGETGLPMRFLNLPTIDILDL